MSVLHLLLCVCVALGQTPRPTPMPSIPIAPADFEALNKIFFDFNAYWTANSSRHTSPMCTMAVSAKNAFDLCFRACDQFQCNAAGEVTALNLGLSYHPVGVNGMLQSTMVSEIGLLTALTTLTANLAGAVQSQVGLLTNLISFSSQKATSLPTTIGAWSKLTSLTLTTDSLTSLPTQVGRLAALSDLYLRCRRLVGLPTQLGQLQALKTVALDVESGVLPDGWSKATFDSFQANNASLTGKIPLFTFDGTPGQCSLRLNAFDTATSLCPLGCYCDRNIVPQPFPTLGSGGVVGRSDAGNADKTEGADDAAGGDSEASLDWVIAAFVIGGLLLGATMGAVVWLAVALRKALRRLAQQGAAPEMHTARADYSARAPSTAVNMAPASRHYAQHASEVHEHMGGNSARQYDALTAFEAGPAVGAHENYDRRLH